MAGILGKGPKVSAVHRNAIIVYQGRFVAAKQAGQVEFFEMLAPELQGEMRRALQTGRRQSASHIKDEWLRVDTPIARPRSLIDSTSRTIRRGMSDN
jgi:hypothetical protein